ncbi:hypothetical protein [Actinoallomurus rhizosphaericola]|uniref:hypothetical protein n=1 Tax=Actinoallomurus rhizosphaericola TaxID=2952536 RepID=UPI0020938B0B|nr:hypothetical protein [Actinoallomurus rhizosphaericola]MCO5996114.1 hypothetical protein [Actinoallomurus rhizosphaericola]
MSDSDPLIVDSSHIRRKASDLRLTARSFDGHHAAFQQEIASHGNPFGADDLGAILTESHQYLFGSVTNCFTSNAQALHGHADRLEELATTYEASERANAARAMRPPSGPPR